MWPASIALAGGSLSARNLLDPERAIAGLEALRSNGVGVSIDDFGTGNASIEYLATLPASELKIDRSFITGMLEDERAEAIARPLPAEELTAQLSAAFGLTAAGDSYAATSPATGAAV